MTASSAAPSASAGRPSSVQARAAPDEPVARIAGVDYFTHGSFKATHGFKIALAIAGSLAIEKPVITWVADHRRHHKYSDKEGYPHLPWRFGSDPKALAKGLAYAHIG